VKTKNIKTKFSLRHRRQGFPIPRNAFAGKVDPLGQLIIVDKLKNKMILPLILKLKTINSSSLPILNGKLTYVNTPVILKYLLIRLWMSSQQNPRSFLSNKIGMKKHLEYNFIDLSLLTSQAITIVLLKRSRKLV
jgi:hypothetical protein